MRHVLCWPTLLALLLGCSPVPQPRVPQPQSSDMRAAAVEQETRSAAKAWLGLIDRGEYHGSWEQAAQPARTLFPREQWVAALCRLRTGLGALETRDLVAVHSIETPSGAPAGEYVELVYQSRFANHATAEHVTRVGEGGVWRRFG